MGDGNGESARGMTTGDGLAVVGLLLFILAWVAGVGWVLGGTDDGDVDRASDFALAVLTLLAVGPPVWAGHHVTTLIGRTVS